MPSSMPRSIDQPSWFTWPDRLPRYRDDPPNGSGDLNPACRPRHLAKTAKEENVMTAFPVPHLDTLGAVPPGLLYTHQADGVAFLISKKRAILADDMGLGKTRQAIVA